MMGHPDQFLVLYPVVSSWNLSLALLTVSLAHSSYQQMCQWQRNNLGDKLATQSEKVILLQLGGVHGRKEADGFLQAN